MQTQQIEKNSHVTMGSQSYTELKNGLIIARPASFTDWYNIQAGKGKHDFSQEVLTVARYQTAMPTSFTLWHGQDIERQPLLVGGVVPMINHSVGWLEAGKNMDKHMLKIIRFAQDEWQRQKQQAVNNCLWFEVGIGHKPGQRMARLCGFKRVAINEHGFEIWEL